MWLERAAHAGDANAQRQLAMAYAAKAAPYEDAQKALQWALVYGENGQAKLYAMAPLPATLIAGLKASLSPEAQAAAARFAADFQVIEMARYIAPIREQGAAQRLRQQRGLNQQRQRPTRATADN